MYKYYQKKIECMENSEKRIVQSKNLKEVVNKMYLNVPWYREKMESIGVTPDDIQSIDDIVKLPFTEKSDLRSNYPFQSFAVPQRDIVRVHASSGTTGKLTVVGYTKRDLSDWATCCARGMYGVGVTRNSVIHVSYGYGLFTGGLGMHYGGEKLGAMVVPASSGNTSRQIMLINDFKADTLCCTPSYAIHIIDELSSMGIDPKTLPLKYGFFGAEPWSENMRKKIEENLPLKAYDIYGLSEITGPGVATECSCQCGSHIQDDMFYPEIINSATGERIYASSSYGEVVFSTLKKQGMPLLRYRTKDIASILSEKCDCGRTSVRLTKITGRYDDMMIVRGVNVFPSQIESALLNCDPRVSSKFRVYLTREDNLDSMSIEVELTQGVAFDEIKEIQVLSQKVWSIVTSSIGVSAKIKLVSSGTIKYIEGEKVKRVFDNRVI